MPAPYSDDFRTKAIAAVKRGERKKDVSVMFNISRNTLDLWLKREEQTGNCQAITNYQQGCRHFYHGLGARQSVRPTTWG